MHGLFGTSCPSYASPTSDPAPTLRRACRPAGPGVVHPSSPPRTHAHAATAAPVRRGLARCRLLSAAAPRPQGRKAQVLGQPQTGGVGIPRAAAGSRGAGSSRELVGAWGAAASQSSPVSPSVPLSVPVPLHLLFSMPFQCESFSPPSLTSSPVLLLQTSSPIPHPFPPAPHTHPLPVPCVALFTPLPVACVALPLLGVRLGRHAPGPLDPAATNIYMRI